MLSTLLLVALAPDSAASAILARYERKLASVASMRAQVRTTGVGWPEVTAAFELRSPGDQRFEFTLNGHRYVFVQGPQGVSELDFATRVYDEWSAPAGLARPDGLVNHVAAMAYPNLLFRSFIRQELRPMPFARVGSEQVSGVATDHLRAVTTGPDGEFTREIWIDAAGVPRRFSARDRTPDGVFDVRQDVLTIAFDVTLPDERFRVIIPSGFSPRALPSAGWPLRVGTQAPTMRWTSGAQPVDPAARFAGTRLLLLVTAPGCRPSARGRAAWAALDADARKAGAAFAELALGTGGRSLGSWPYFVDTGTFERSINPPGTPFLVLFDGNMTILGYWFGYQPAEAEAVRADIGRLLRPE